MNQGEAASTLPPERLVESVTRTLRHEVGDLLQTVYSTVAILQERLGPTAQLERRFLGDLRARAETCKFELDAVHDLVLPMKLNIAPTDLTELAAGLVASFSSRQKSIKVRVEESPPLPIEADAARLLHVGRLLLEAAYQSARHEIVVRTGKGGNPNEVEWSIRDDGHGVSPEQLQWLATAFSTTQQALSGLGMALARRVAELHGGRVAVKNVPDEGFEITLVLPRRPRPAQG